MKPIYSAVIYEINRRNGEQSIKIKVPCTSEKAAIEYRKILAKWWKGYHSRIDTDYPVTIATCKALNELPF